MGIRIAISPGAAADILADELRSRFEWELADPAEYERRALRECMRFPEGDLFPFVFPVIGYVNDALARPERTSVACERAALLVEMAIRSVSRRVDPPGGRLDALSDYQEHAIHLGQLALALGYYRLIGRDARWERIHRRLADVLHEALVRADGRPLCSEPGLMWPFDTIPCLVALKLFDQCHGTQRSAEVITRHLEWVRTFGTDPELGLPYSQVDHRTGEPLEPPRGCEFTFRAWLQAHLDRELTRSQYRAFCRNFWIERFVVAGFAEWAHGRNLGEDSDSGPIVLGIGLAATGLGLGAARACGDQWRLGRLCLELGMRKVLFPPLRPVLGRLMPFDGRYLTGMLMGDASMFAVAGWRAWG